MEIECRMYVPCKDEVVLRGGDGCWLSFRNPLSVLRADRHDQVIPVLNEAASCGKWAVGFVSYEAARAFDPAFPASKINLPLVWFGVYDEPLKIDLPAVPEPGPLKWRCDQTQREYSEKVARIKHYIAEGDTYQVNYTLRFKSSLNDPWQFFVSRMSHSRFSAYIRTADQIVCSSSPELFFELNNKLIICQPMKGTARGREDLLNSVKDRAENVMIVDMIRNDLGRICSPGSIVANPLFAVERWGDIHQMTSTVRGLTSATLTEIFAALFPCASITGAPKCASMKIIDELESSARGVYCGAVGYIAPGRQARFSVAIRTVQIGQSDGVAIYGAGGGIVWASQPMAEWCECTLKTEVLHADTGGIVDPAVCEVSATDRACVEHRLDFCLFETMLYDNGIIYVCDHIDRLSRSALELGFKLNVAELIDILNIVSSERLRLRLSLASDGRITVESELFPKEDEKLRKVCFAAEPVDPQNRMLYHKTSKREIYNKAKTGLADVDDVILWNKRGEVTESTVANVVASIDGEMITPPLRCGLLPGTMRASLLREGVIKERVIRCDELNKARNLYLINSLRGWMNAELKN